MTKYILHGGETGRKTKDNKKLFIEMTNELSDRANILCVYFSRPKKIWPQLFKQDKINFSSASLKKDFNFTLADDKTDALTNQIKKADVIYLRGGDTDMLKKTLNKVEKLVKLWQGKIVSGSSAGAYVLSKYYYSNDKACIKEGLGVLPIKTFCHYSKDKSDKLEGLKKHGEDLKIYAIPEEKFIIIEQ